MKKHEYTTTLRWTGNRGTGTSGYKAYGRDHEITGPAKASTLQGSSDPHFRGDVSRYNPEDLLVAALSACHMLSYLHLCAVNHVVEVTLRPRVTITAASEAGKLCFIARSVNFPVHHAPVISNS